MDWAMLPACPESWVFRLPHHGCLVESQPDVLKVPQHFPLGHTDSHLIACVKLFLQPLWYCSPDASNWWHEQLAHQQSESSDWSWWHPPAVLYIGPQLLQKTPNCFDVFLWDLLCLFPLPHSLQYLLCIILVFNSWNATACLHKVCLSSRERVHSIGHCFMHLFISSFLLRSMEEVLCCCPACQGSCVIGPPRLVSVTLRHSPICLWGCALVYSRSGPCPN